MMPNQKLVAPNEADHFSFCYTEEEERRMATSKEMDSVFRNNLSLLLLAGLAGSRS
jgi:hypothetical protein